MIRDRLQEIGVALALLTRLPLPRLGSDAFERQATSGWAWPLAGLVVGTLAALAGMAALALGLPAGVAALLIVAVQIAVTGAMHEDGLADTADGFWGGWTPERRLEIMKDSHIGTYGVLALVLSAGLRWSLYAALVDLGPGPVIACAMLSRAALPAMMTALPNARGGGLSHKVGTPPVRAVWAAIVLAGLAALLLTGWAGLAAALAVATGAVALGGIALRKIGGQTGDILGATQQVGEALAAMALLAVPS